MKRPAAARPLKRPAAASVAPQAPKRPAKRPASASAVPEHAAKVFLALRRHRSRQKPSADLLGVFRSAEAAVACAARAEAPCAFAPGSRVEVDLYEQPLGGGSSHMMPTEGVHGTVRERKEGSVSDTVRYVVDIEHRARLGPPGAPLKQRLPKLESDLHIERTLKEKRNPPTLRAGISGTTNLIEVSREHLRRCFRREAVGDRCNKTASGDCDNDGDDAKSNSESDVSNDHAADSGSECSFHEHGFQYVVEENGLEQEISDDTGWVAIQASSRNIPGDIRAAASLAAANDVSKKRFKERCNMLREELTRRKTTSRAKAVSADVLLGEPGTCLKMPAKHCFASTIRDGSFVGGICDYCEDDYSDIDTDEEIDFTEKAYKEFHWIERVRVGEDLPLPKPTEKRRQPEVPDRGELVPNGEVHIALATSGQTEHPWQLLLGLRTDATSARTQAAAAERMDPLESGMEVRCECFQGSCAVTPKGVIRCRCEDDCSEHFASYFVDLTYDDDARTLGPPGAPLPLTVPNKYSKKENTLQPGVQGTTSAITIPRALLRTRHMGDDLTKFEVQRVPIHGETDIRPCNTRLAKLLGTSRCGLPLDFALQDHIFMMLKCHIWVSHYEPSTTGWGDACSCVAFHWPIDANAHARTAFKSRIRNLRQVSAPQPKFLQPEDEPGLFKRLPVSKMFAQGYPGQRRFTKVVDKQQQCFAKTYKKGLFVAAVSNYHGEHLGGCGNPYMAEWWWVERRAVNCADEKPFKPPPERRTPGGGDCVVA